VVDPTMYAVEVFRKRRDGAGIDVLRELVGVLAERLTAEEADAICGARYGERSEDLISRRKGFRTRTVDTGVGTIGAVHPEALREERIPGLVARVTSAGQSAPSSRS
jgi:putative transposase